METPKEIPAGWKVKAMKDSGVAGSPLRIVLCERVPLDELNMNWVTWLYDSSPEFIAQYSSTCVHGNYFGSYEDAMADFNKRS